MYNISMGGGRSEQSSHKSAASSGSSSNPFTPSNDPLKQLYPNASAGMSGGVDGKSGALPSGAAVSSGKDVSFLTQDNTSSHGSGAGSSSGRSKKEEFDWLNAEMAKHYDMSKETGYQEAMENTSYQRAVKDMKAAGLNPAVLFGNNAGDMSGTPGYIRSASSGGGGGGGGYSRSYGSARSNKWLSSNKYSAVAGIGSVVGGIAGLVSTKRVSGAAAGAAAGSAIATGVAKIINGILND